MFQYHDIAHAMIAIYLLRDNDFAWRRGEYIRGATI